MSTSYITDEAEGENWKLLLGDSCERRTLDDEIESPALIGVEGLR